MIKKNTYWKNIKICGIKDSTTLDCCQKNNVNFYGLVFYNKSPRNISIESASKLINYQTNSNIIPVGIFSNHNINEVCRIIKKLNLKYIQLHGNENNTYISKLKDKFSVKIIKAIGIKLKNDLEKVNMYSNADFYLFDYKPNKNELPGGNAKSFDWSFLKNINIDKPWFISGGINIGNIDEILNNLIPYGIDISSGVEDLPGIKNSKKITEMANTINV